MCGRFALYAPAGDLTEVFGVDVLPELVARYNIAPTDEVLGVRAFSGGRMGELYRWGLVPWWSKDASGGARMINARSEKAATAPAFRDAMAFRRLLVPASGFYEWRRVGGQRLPVFYRREDGAPMAFAGLWERWRGPDGELRSCTILTTDANDLVRPVHDRMPVILPPTAWTRWLDPDLHDPAEVQHLLAPYPREDLVAVPVSQRVNSVRNEGPELVDPVANEEP